MSGSNPPSKRRRVRTKREPRKEMEGGKHIAGNAAKPKALITGGAGFIGFWLSRRLALQGYDVTIVDNFARGREDDEFRELLAMPNVTFVHADITDPRSFEQLGTGYDHIYHLAAINGTGNFYSIPDKVLKVGILGTINILDWFIQQPKGKLLFSSSSETYAGAVRLLGDSFPIPTPETVPLVVEDPSNVRWSYGGSKILSEIAIHSYAKAHAMNRFTIVRYHNIYGPRMGFEHVVPQFIERIVKKENPFALYGGHETRTFLYVDDGAWATQLIMENESTNGQTFHIGRSDDEIKIMDVAKILFAIAHVNPAFEVRSSPAGSVTRRCPDTTKLRALGFAPTVDLREGLKRCYDWYENRFPQPPHN